MHTLSNEETIALCEAQYHTLGPRKDKDRKKYDEN